MTRRLTVAVAGLAVVAVAMPGYATTKAKPKPRPKPSCLMLTDLSGDAKINGQGNSYDVDDIVSADIATGKKTIVGVLRLKSGDAASGIPTGATYRFMWTQTQRGSDGKTSTSQAAFFFYVYATGGSSAGYGFSTSSSSPPFDSSSTVRPKASMDANGVITWVLSRKDAGLSSGVKFSNLSAATTLSVNYQVLGGTSKFNTDNGRLDDATGHASYTDLQPSCVRAA